MSTVRFTAATTKTAAAPKVTSSVAAEYVFLSGLDKSYSSSTRAHVLRRHMGERAKATRSEKQFRGSRAQGRAHQISSRASTQKNERRGHDQLNCSNCPPENTDDSTCAKGCERKCNRSVSGWSSCPTDDPGLDVISPFIKPVIVYEHRLFSYVFDASFDHWKVSSKIRIYPPRDITLPLTIQDELCSDAMVAYGAQALCYNSRLSSAKAAAYRLSTIGKLNERLSDPTQYVSDGTILTVALLLEMKTEIASLNPKGFSTGEARELSIHIQGLRQMIAVRGGLRVLSRVRYVGWDVHWADILLWGEISAGLTPLSPYAFHWPAKLRLPGGSDRLFPATLIPDIGSARAYAEELIGAYGSFYRQAQLRFGAPETLFWSAPFEQNLSLRALFQPGSPVHRLLTEARFRIAMPPATLPLYWNILLGMFQHKDIADVHRFCRYIHSVMVEGGLESSGTAEALYWILSTDVDRRCVGHAESIWLLARLLRVVKKLSFTLQLQLETQLLSFLTGNSYAANDHSWHPEAFRLAIIEDLDLSDD